MNCNAAPEDERSFPANGRRREPPATCYFCGGDVEDTPRFGNEHICYDCERTGKALDPWLVREGPR